MVALPPTLHGGLPKPSLQAPSHSAATPQGSAGRDAGTLHLANGDDAEGDPLVGADDTGPSSDSAHGDVTESLRSYARDRIAAGGAVRECRPKGDPEQVKVHDFVIPERGKAIPQGVRVTDEQMQSINLSRHEFHGDWNDP